MTRSFVPMLFLLLLACGLRAQSGAPNFQPESANYASAAVPILLGARMTFTPGPAALDTATNAIIITDSKGKILWVNSAFSLLTGYIPVECEGKDPQLLLRSRPRYAGPQPAMRESLAAGNVWRGEMVNQRKDGSRYIEEMTVTPVKNERGEITHYIAVKQDITARVESLRAQRAGEARSRPLVEHTRDKFWMSSADFKEMLCFSPACERIWGRPAQYLYDNPQGWIEMLQPEDRGGVVAGIARSLDGGADTALGTLVTGVAHEMRYPLFGIMATIDAFRGELHGPRGISGIHRPAARRNRPADPADERSAEVWPAALAGALPRIRRRAVGTGGARRPAAGGEKARSHQTQDRAQSS